MTSSQTPIEAHPERWICGVRTRPDAEPRTASMAHFTLERVAIAMAYQNRFLGMWGPASLTDHSIRVARMVRPELRLAALFHDAGEIATGDIPKPYKRFAPELVTLENEWRRKIVLHLCGDRLGLQTLSLCEHPDVKKADAEDYFNMLEGQALQLEHLERRVKEYAIGPRIYDRGVDSARAWAGAVRAEIDFHGGTGL